MSAKRVPINQRRSQTGQSKPAIKPVGTDAFFEPEATTRTEAKETAIVEPAEKAGTESGEAKESAKKKSKGKGKSAPKKETEEKENLVKTTVYIEEDNFLALEDIQLKLKRKERRRVTKNELFNKAIELLVKHYSD